jgi:hypothetical protein
MKDFSDGGLPALEGQLEDIFRNMSDEGRIFFFPNLS